MKKFWVFWGFDALVAAVVLFFFCAGLADGSVSSANLGLWLAILLVLAVVLGGAFALRSAGKPVLALVLLSLLALPGLLAALFFVLILIAQPRWN